MIFYKIQWYENQSSIFTFKYLGKFMAHLCLQILTLQKQEVHAWWDELLKISIIVIFLYTKTNLGSVFVFHFMQL